MSDYDDFARETFAGETRFSASHAVVDGITSAINDTYTRSMFQVMDQHDCTGYDDCGFGFRAEAISQLAKDQRLPTEVALSDAYRWMPGDPVYRPGGES